MTPKTTTKPLEIINLRHKMTPITPTFQTRIINT